MKIGSVDIPGIAVLAPMAGITDLPFRLLCKEQGAALVFTEMISAEGLIRKQGGTRSLLETCAEEKPVGFQLFGKNPDSMREAAKRLSDKGADLIDINMGCPVRKVVSGGSGAALLKDLDGAEAIIRAAVEGSKVPVTVKIRTGWNMDDYVDAELARIAEGAGASAVTVHGRYARQMFAGRADWSRIAAVKAAVSIPVIGNGDVVTAADAKRMMDETGCDFVMVGRGAMGNPWLFREINALINDGEAVPPPAHTEIGATLLRHLRMVVEKHGERVGVKMMRKHAGWYSRGMHGGAEFRRTINHTETAPDFESAVSGFFI